MAFAFLPPVPRHATSILEAALLPTLFSFASSALLLRAGAAAKMGRMHTPGKGMSSSALPYKRSPPSWLKTTGIEVRARGHAAALGSFTPRAP